tara:strand:+ start:211 stop:1245 length:1035 start_codon:yes stop_codon:yes gene_type:complete
MSTYEEIKGMKIREYTTNPDDPLEGQLWYNQTDSVAKYSALVTTAAFSTGTAYNNGRSSGGAAGTRTSGLISGGTPGAPGNFNHTAQTESWNGSSWTEVGDLNQRRNATRGVGPNNTAALTFGGGTPGQPIGDNSGVLVESWNGSAWTEVADLSQNKDSVGPIGTYNDALCVGGNNPGIAQNEKWNGSSWTELADLNQGRGALGAGGTASTSGIVFGGFISPSPPEYWTEVTEVWNGSAWTEVADLNQKRSGLGGTGSSTAALAIGGRYDGNPVNAITENWNGSSWTEIADLGTGRYNTFTTQAGPSTFASAIGGAVGPLDSMTTAVEDFNGVGAVLTKTISTD